MAEKKHKIPAVVDPITHVELSMFGVNFRLDISEAITTRKVPKNNIFGTQLPADYTSHHLDRKKRAMSYPGFAELLTETDPVPVVAVPGTDKDGAPIIRLAAVDHRHAVRASRCDQLHVAIYSPAQMAAALGMSEQQTIDLLNSQLDHVMNAFEERGMDPRKHPSPVRRGLIDF